MKIKLDENLGERGQRLLAAAGHDVCTVPTQAQDNRLSPATVAKRVSVAKQVFHAAVEWDWIVKNPFVKLRTGSQANPKRACYVPLATILDVLVDVDDRACHATSIAPSSTPPYYWGTRNAAGIEKAHVPRQFSRQK